MRAATLCGPGCFGGRSKPRSTGDVIEGVGDNALSMYLLLTQGLNSSAIGESVGLSPRLEPVDILVEKGRCSFYRRQMGIYTKQEMLCLV